MLAAYFLGVGLLVAVPSEEPNAPRPPDVAEYQAASERVGRDPDAHVKLALWCEAHRLRAESVKHLALALLNDPKNALARGLMGLVAHEGHWQRPEVVAAEVQADASRAAAMAEYNARREAMPDSADAHGKLGLWCEQKGLKPEAMAHFTAVVRLNPRAADAWKRLGCVPYQGHWMKPEQVNAQKAEVQAQKDADISWKAALIKARPALHDRATRAATIDALKVAGEPRAVRAIWEVYARGNAEHQLTAVEMLQRIDGPVASHALAYLAGRSPHLAVHTAAQEELRTRDPRDCVDVLIGFLVAKIKYQILPSQGLNHPGELVFENPKYNVRRLYSPPFNPGFIDFSQFMPENNTDPRPSSHLGLEWYEWGANSRYTDLQIMKLRQAANLASTLSATANRATFLANEQLRRDIGSLETINRNIDRNNDSVSTVLMSITGANLGKEPENWMEWWVDKKGYAYERPRETFKPTYTVDVPIPIPVANPFRIHSACFGAGTPVRTLEGNRPIESLQVGDQVLSQDPTRGFLSFQPVVAVYHNPPSPTLKLTLEGGPPIVATGIHRFWKPGQGWTMARDLKPGDLLRTVGGTTKLLATEPDAEQPVFNLDVAHDRDFFVGDAGALVHDFSLVQPVAKPFDAAPELVAIGAPGR